MRITDAILVIVTVMIISMVTVMIISMVVRASYVSSKRHHDEWVVECERQLEMTPAQCDFLYGLK